MIPISINDINDPTMEQRFGEFAQNDIWSRQSVSYMDIFELPQLNAEEMIEFPDVYDVLFATVPTVLMIDLKDVSEYLRRKHGFGASVVDISTIAYIVCEFLGKEAELHEQFFTSFDDEASETLMGELGLDQSNALASDSFNRSEERRVGKECPV